MACGDSGSGGAGGTAAGGSGGTNTGGTGGANTGGANTGGSGGTNEAGAGGANTGGAGGAGGQDVTAQCTDACSTAYDCGVEGGNCPGFSGDPAEKATFVGMVGAGGCLDSCIDNPVLIAVIDPANCQGTIATLSGASSEFADACANGF